MDSAPPTVTANHGRRRPRAPGWDRLVAGDHRAAGGGAIGRSSELLAIDRGGAGAGLQDRRCRPGLSWALAVLVAQFAVTDLGADHRVADRPADRAGVDPGRRRRRSSRSLIGIAVAIWLGGLIGLHAWSIAVIVAVGFLVGKVLRLNGGAAAQIPINGLFVLALGSRRRQVEQRFLDTLIGAGVAVVVNFAVVPPNYVSQRDPVGGRAGRRGGRRAGGDRRAASPGRGPFEHAVRLAAHRARAGPIRHRGRVRRGDGPASRCSCIRAGRPGRTRWTGCSRPTTPCRSSRCRSGRWPGRCGTSPPRCRTGTARSRRCRWPRRC